ncbi:hypothetical protein DAPPUDRAFT_340275, partial [Daphnia pulex]
MRNPTHSKRQEVNGQINDACVRLIANNMARCSKPLPLMMANWFQIDQSGGKDCACAAPLVANMERPALNRMLPAMIMAARPPFQPSSSAALPLAATCRVIMNDSSPAACKVAEICSNAFNAYRRAIDDTSKAKTANAAAANCGVKSIQGNNASDATPSQGKAAFGVVSQLEIFSGFAFLCKFQTTKQLIA